MDILEHVIEHLSSDEVRRFKIISKRFRGEDEKKLILLFDAIRAGSFKENEEQALLRLYGRTDARARNTYYRLRNKLLDNLEKSLLFYHFSGRNRLSAYNYLQMAELMRQRSLHREVHYYLKKAEKAAQEQEQFSLLEVIYGEWVQLALYFPFDLEPILAARRENLRRMEFLRAQHETLGLITRQLSRRNYARSKKTESVIDTLEGIRQQLEEHQDLFQSISGKFLIIKTVASILIQKSAYEELESYARQSFEALEAQGLLGRAQHGKRLLLRVWRVNALHKLSRLEAAAEQLDALERELHQGSKVLQGEYAFHYALARMHNLKLRGDWPAAQRLAAALAEQAELWEPENHAFFLHLSLAELHFLTGDFERSAESLRQALQSPAFAQMDEEIRLYTEIFALLPLLEQKHFAAFLEQAALLRKRHAPLLKDAFYLKAARFLEILQQLARQGGNLPAGPRTWQRFREEFPPSEAGSNQIINYELYLCSWLSGGRPYAELLIEKASGKLPA